MFSTLGKTLAPKKLVGDKAEQLAKEHLLKQGLIFVEQNVYSRMGEIDLVFREGVNTLIFVEVKYRSDSQFGSADEMVTLSKQKKIIKTASTYLQKKGLTETVITRFDVIAIEPMNNQDKALSIRWIKDAFQAF